MNAPRTVCRSKNGAQYTALRTLQLVRQLMVGCRLKAVRQKAGIEALVVQNCLQPGQSGDHRSRAEIHPWITRQRHNIAVGLSLYLSIQGRVCSFLGSLCRGADPSPFGPVKCMVN